MNPEARLSEMFPRLACLGHIELNAPGFGPLMRSREESHLWSWVPGMSRANTLGELLDIRLLAVRSWAGIGPKRLTELMELLEWMDHIVGDSSLVPEAGEGALRAEALTFAGSGRFGSDQWSGAIATERVSTETVTDSSGFGDPSQTLREMFPGLESLSWASFTYWRITRTAVTDAEKRALDLIATRSNSRSMAKVLTSRVDDVLQWPGVGDDELLQILSFLQKLQGVVGATHRQAAKTPRQATARTANHRSLAGVVEPPGPQPRTKAAAIDDPMTGLLGDVFPQLWFLADVDLRSPWLDEFTTDKGRKEALRYIRRGPRVPTIGDLLRLNTDTIVSWPGVGKIRRGQILDFLAHLGGEAYESRLVAVHVVSAWVASTRGRATWANLLAATDDPKPPEVERAWGMLAETPITEVRTRTAPSVIVDYVTGLEELDRTVLMEHCLAQAPRSTQDIADRFATTVATVRRRIQFLEAEVRAHVAGTDSWLPVAWAVEARQSGIVQAEDASPTGVGRSDAEVARLFVGWLTRTDHSRVIHAEIAAEVVPSIPALEIADEVLPSGPEEAVDSEIDVPAEAVQDGSDETVFPKNDGPEPGEVSTLFGDAFTAAGQFISRLSPVMGAILERRIVYPERSSWSDIGIDYAQSATKIRQLEISLVGDVRYAFEFAKNWAPIRAYCLAVEAGREPYPPQGPTDSPDSTAVTTQFLRQLCDRVADGELNPGTEGPF
ncbi:hypothetical protein ABIE44_002729 [Marmoricola sp. OAE513]|uniref:hypothetical protein n=1 Tax=Marmoricola sp. OAE513 TaxID=2817894 RepID=UPI001AE91B70